MKKTHGNTGNRSASKGDKAKNAMIALRCTQKRKDDLSELARAKGTSLSKYILDKL